MERAAVPGLQPGDGYGVVSHGEDGLSVIHHGESSFFAGSLSALSLGDVFGHLLANISTGMLVVSLGAMRKTISLRDGQIVFATSTERHERLGSALIRLGLVSREQLDQALLQVGARARLGQVLTRMGLVSAANLYSGMTFLVREIIVNLFELADGHFLFSAKEVQPDSLKLPERTKTLVLEGMKRGDEVLRLRHRLPLSLKVKLPPGGAPRGTDSLSSLVVRGATLAELRPRFDGSDHAFLTWSDEQLRSGEWVQVPDEPVAPPSEPLSPVRSPLELYSDLIAAICGALNGEGEDLAQLRTFLEAPPKGMEGVFTGVTLSDAGRLDISLLLKNLGGEGSAKGRARAFEALDSFVAYALFAAQNVLAPQVAERLAESFRRMREGR